jgi:hypothetical protein
MAFPQRLEGAARLVEGDAAARSLFADKADILRDAVAFAVQRER